MLIARSWQILAFPGQQIPDVTTFATSNSTFAVLDNLAKFALLAATGGATGRLTPTRKGP